MTPLAFRSLLVLATVLCPMLGHAEEKPDPGNQRIGNHFRTLQGAAQAGIDPLETPAAKSSEVRVLSVGEQPEESATTLRYVLLGLGSAGVLGVGVLLARKKS